MQWGILFGPYQGILPVITYVLLGLSITVLPGISLLIARLIVFHIRYARIARNISLLHATSHGIFNSAQMGRERPAACVSTKDATSELSEVSAFVTTFSCA